MKVKILKTINFPIAGEQTVIFELNGKIYEAFNFESSFFAENEIADIELSFFAYNIFNTGAKYKKILYSKYAPLEKATYRIWANITEIKNGTFTANAGKGFIFTISEDLIGIKINDYARIEGRLNIKRTVNE